MGADRIGSVGATNTVGDMDLPSRVFFYRMRGTVSHEPRVDNLSIWFDGRWYVHARRCLRSAEPRPIEIRAKAEAAALEYLAQIEEPLETNPRTRS